jgi:hypothetical protein
MDASARTMELLRDIPRITEYIDDLTFLIAEMTREAAHHYLADR